MRSLRHAILAALLLPVLGHAASSIDHVKVTCSSSMSQGNGPTLGYMCDGDLSLQGDGQIGTLWSDTGITLAAIGNLTLDRLSLVSPQIGMQSVFGTISVSADTRFFAAPGDLTTAPAVDIRAGFSQTAPAPTLTPVDTSAGLIMVGRGVLPIGESTVPESTSAMLIMLGLAGMAWMRRKH
ncbi:PEP-CTERM sorting domain-containing protein [Aquabacterium sp.]|uniref:PEP-CTERM sorting domain-containing protein n=1 Tax=Aquabacterium sp. TaxID=1872578 RepID=UPI0040384908